MSSVPLLGWYLQNIYAKCLEYRTVIRHPNNWLGETAPSAEQKNLVRPLNLSPAAKLNVK